MRRGGEQHGWAKQGYQEGSLPWREIEARGDGGAGGPRAPQSWHHTDPPPGMWGQGGQRGQAPVLSKCWKLKAGGDTGTGVCPRRSAPGRTHAAAAPPVLEEGSGWGGGGFGPSLALDSPKKSRRGRTGAARSENRQQHQEREPRVRAPVPCLGEKPRARCQPPAGTSCPSTMLPAALTTATARPRGN